MSHLVWFERVWLFFLKSRSTISRVLRTRLESEVGLSIELLSLVEKLI